MSLCFYVQWGLKVFINWSSTCRPLQPAFPHMSLGMYLPQSRELRICFACWAVSLKRWEKRGLIQGFINLRVDCDRNLSYIGTVSGNRLRRRGRRVGYSNSADSSRLASLSRAPEEQSSLCGFDSQLQAHQTPWEQGKVKVVYDCLT